MKKVLISGATGALGRQVLEVLKEDDDLELYSIGRSVVSGVKKHILSGDSLSESLVNAYLEVKPDLIFHLVGIFNNDFDESYELNVHSPYSLLSRIHSDSSQTRVVLVGSAAELGIIEDTGSKITENMALNPVSVYGLTKAWQAQLVSYFSHLNVNVIYARIFNLYGEGVSANLLPGRIYEQMSALKKGDIDKIKVGSLHAYRDFISTNEAAHHMVTIGKVGKPGEIYNVASGVTIQAREWVKNELQRNGLSMDVLIEENSIPRPNALIDNRNIVDIEKLKNLEQINS